MKYYFMIDIEGVRQIGTKTWTSDTWHMALMGSL